MYLNPCTPDRGRPGHVFVVLSCIKLPQNLAVFLQEWSVKDEHVQGSKLIMMLPFNSCFGEAGKYRSCTVWSVAFMMQTPSHKPLSRTT